jgi:hypothetical protein
MPETITARINFFGPFIEEGEIPKILDPTLSTETESILKHKRGLLEYFFGLSFTALSQEVLERFIEVTSGDLCLPVAPHTEQIFERLLKPLRSAKRNYCLGDYLASISACGVVGEMLAILIWKMNEVHLGSQCIDEEHEKGLFGSTFERLGQERRLNVLKTFGFIGDSQYQALFEIKESRRRYLHFWETDLKKEKEDALMACRKSFQLFRDITGIGIVSHESISVNPLLIKFFGKQGVKKP